jgi:putative chitinase
MATAGVKHMIKNETVDSIRTGLKEAISLSNKTDTITPPKEEKLSEAIVEAPKPIDPNTRPVSEELLKAVMPKADIKWLDPINKIFYKYDLEGSEAAMLLAHMGHESSDLNRLVENMNYSAERLMQVWPSRFKTLSLAKEYERNPQKLANFVYGGRMGNDKLNEGWLYRGRGALQVTGKINYGDLSRWTKVDYLSNPDLVNESLEDCILSAVWYWRVIVRTRNTSIEVSTRTVNGGLNGLADRKARYERGLAVINKQKK